MIARSMLLALVASNVALAQDVRPAGITADKGMQVRVKAQGFREWQVGTIHLIDTESLVLQLADEGRPLVSFPMSAVESVQRRQRRGGLWPIAIGATIGGLAGVAIGSRIGQSLYYPDAEDTVNQGYLMAVPGGAVGALTGGIIGALKGPKGWVPVAIR